jgi:2'-5' RNA ligase
VRLFIGTELSDSLRSAAAGITNRLRRRVERSSPKASVRWVEPANLHITVWFLGEVREPQDGAVVDALTAALDVQPFTMRVKGAGAFPPSGPLRTIWLGLAAGRDGLVAIHDALRSRLTPLGFMPEKRPYSPHLTIARVKEVGTRDSALLRRILQETRDDIGGCDVTHATLFRSRTSPAGAQYEPLLRIPLG